MAFPPGIIHLSKVLPGVLAPAIGISFLKWLVETYLNVHASRWVFALVCLLSFPLALTFRVQYKLWVDRRAAAAYGAILPPALPSSIGGIDLIRTMVRQMAESYPGEPMALLEREFGHTYCMRVLFEDRFITSEPEYVKIMLATQFSGFEKGEDTRAIFGPLLGSGVFAADGELWKFHRAMTRPFFKRDRISDFELFDRHSLQAIAQIKNRLHEGYAVDFQDVISRFAMDASTEFLFGHDAQTLSAGLPYPFYVPLTAASAPEHRSTKFAAALNRAQLISSRRFPSGASWPLLEFWNDKLKGSMAVIHAFLDPILDEAVARKQSNGVEKPTDVEGDISDDREVQEGETLVEHLLNYTEDRTMLRDEILNISVAGRDTTASLLTFVIYMLSGHPEVLAKVRSEILTTVGLARAPTPEDFREMKYLRAVLNETLRLYPPVPFNMRSTTTPIILPSTTGGKPFYLPANSKVPYSVLIMHRRTDLWGPDAAQWDPDRFMDERLHRYLTPNPFIFLPFNAGPRICLGQQFAYHEASFFLIRLLQNFSGISLASDAQPPASRVPPTWAQDDELGWRGGERLMVKNHLTMFIEGGVWVTMKEENLGDMES